MWEYRYRFIKKDVKIIYEFWIRNFMYVFSIWVIVRGWIICMIIKWFCLVVVMGMDIDRV